MKKIVFSSFLALFLIGGVACSTGSENKTETTISETKKAETYDVSLSLIVDEKVVKTDEVNVTKNDSVLDILQNQFETEEKGGIISKIDGIEQEPNNNKYWMFYVNDQEATKGAKDVFVSEGDKIEWRLNEFK